MLIWRHSNICRDVKKHIYRKVPHTSFHPDACIWSKNRTWAVSGLESLITVKHKLQSFQWRTIIIAWYVLLFYNFSSQWCHNGQDGVLNHQPHVVYSIIYSGADQRKHQSSTSLDFVWGIHRWPVNSPHKGPVTQKMFPFDDVIMYAYTWPPMMK